MTPNELVHEIWRIGLMESAATRMENAIALVEADRHMARHGSHGTCHGCRYDALTVEDWPDVCPLCVRLPRTKVSDRWQM